MYSRDIILLILKFLFLAVHARVMIAQGVVYDAGTCCLLVSFFSIEFAVCGHHNY